MALTSWLLLHCFQGRRYEIDGGVMSHDLTHKKCRINVFVMFCYLDGTNGSLSCFADVKPVLGTLASTEAYSSSQIYNQCSTSASEKNDHGFGTKSSNNTLCFFLGTLIHVEILLTVLIEINIIPRNLYWFLSSKKCSFTSPGDGKIQVVTDQN